jgi:hypothetical protein
MSGEDEENEDTCSSRTNTNGSQWNWTIAHLKQQQHGREQENLNLESSVGTVKGSERRGEMGSTA